MDFLKADSIVKEFTNHKALDEVSITVPENSIFGLLGPNGAGKTTLIRIINRITAPDRGNILFKERSFQPADIENIGYLPEERGLYKKMKVGEQALYLAQLKGMSRNDAMKKLKYWFEKFEITDWWQKKVEELSKGMQQKVQFITTVVHEPQLIIFDEPFSGFDPINANLLKNEILGLRANGATIIFSTHNMGSVEELCDHISLINKSKVILNGETDAIKRNYRSNTFEISYVGNSANLKKALPPDFEILHEKMNHNINFVKVKSTTTPDNNKLLASLINQVEIHSFNEVIPSMNEVFIKVVQDNN